MVVGVVVGGGVQVNCGWASGMAGWHGVDLAVESCGMDGWYGWMKGTKGGGGMEGKEWMEGTVDGPSEGGGSGAGADGGAGRWWTGPRRAAVPFKYERTPSRNRPN